MGSAREIPLFVQSDEALGWSDESNGDEGKPNELHTSVITRIRTYDESQDQRGIRAANNLHCKRTDKNEMPFSYSRQLWMPSSLTSFRQLKSIDKKSSLAKNTVGPSASRVPVCHRRIWNDNRNKQENSLSRLYSNRRSRIGETLSSRRG